jgi:hypothetical protein
VSAVDEGSGALGGVLIVDEAYSLAGDEYGDEAIATLVKAIEDHARYVRNGFEVAVLRQAWRLRRVSAPTVDQLRELTGADLAPPP